MMCKLCIMLKALLKDVISLYFQAGEQLFSRLSGGLSKVFLGHWLLFHSSNCTRPFSGSFLFYVCLLIYLTQINYSILKNVPNSRVKSVLSLQTASRKKN